jgi:hypothetical protein
MPYFSMRIWAREYLSRILAFTYRAVVKIH